MLVCSLSSGLSLAASVLFSLAGSLISLDVVGLSLERPRSL
jgi:hypothetical protein